MHSATPGYGRSDPPFGPPSDPPSDPKGRRSEHLPDHRPAWLDDDTLAVVRPQVRKLLEASPGFQALADEKKRDIARQMVNVAAYMANPDGLAKRELTPGQNVVEQPGVLARQQDAVDDAKAAASKEVGNFAGKDFQAGAVQQGVQQFGELVQKVDFPLFVAGLIHNVFEAIVNSSIKQMEAYGKLLASVSQSVADFARDNISQNNARDWLMQKYPDQLGLDTSSADSGGSNGQPATPRLTASGDDPSTFLKTLSTEFGMSKPVDDLSDPEQEGMLVQAAQVQIAKSRQQLLASMVMLGINRIVVTDGMIHAKVIFDLKASDQAQRQARASLYDRNASRNVNTSVAGGGWGFFGAATANQNVQDHVTTVQSSVDETSESKAEVKANLTGEVRVNFKSDYLPMEKMATPQMIASIQGNATPYDPNNPNAHRPGAAPAAAPAAAAPAPQPAAAH
ncbi:hypothetical protein [Andreprevotia chitinilytica]|uniref:hypothetical protein n=1 Tax=Andreprevotia chitinilytica TaxID=396808 RepID=UPI001B8031C7|nr:hypothetical protein [Andreprevotia chitinilytica]